MFVKVILFWNLIIWFLEQKRQRGPHDLLNFSHRFCSFVTKQSRDVSWALGVVHEVPKCQMFCESPELSCFCFIK